MGLDTESLKLFRCGNGAGEIVATVEMSVDRQAGLSSGGTNEVEDLVIAVERAHIVPNEGVPFPPSFDGAYVTVAVGTLRLRFCRGRGDFSVGVASEFAPQDWEDFRLLADGISEWDTSQPRSACPYSLDSFERVLRPRLAALQEALSRERFEGTLNNAVKTHNASVEEYAASLRQSGINPKFY